MTLPPLTTHRLWLRAARVEDASDLHVAYRDADWARYWHLPPSRSTDETATRLSELLERSPGHWAFGRHGDDTVLGHVGFVSELEPKGHAGFGYALRPSAWGDGLTTEAARAALDHAFTVVGIARVELWIHRANRRSIRVAEKLGCERRAETYVGWVVGPTPIFVYGVTAEAWSGGEEPSTPHLGVEPIVAVSDVGAALEWWRDILGFRVGFVHGDPPSQARLLARWTGGSSVQLTAAGLPGGGRVFITVGGDLDELADRAAPWVVRPLGVRSWGMREVELADDDGNSVRLATPGP